VLRSQGNGVVFGSARKMGAGQPSTSSPSAARPIPAGSPGTPTARSPSTYASASPSIKTPASARTAPESWGDAVAAVAVPAARRRSAAVPRWRPAPAARGTSCPARSASPPAWADRRRTEGRRGHRARGRERQRLAVDGKPGETGGSLTLTGSPPSAGGGEADRQPDPVPVHRRRPDRHPRVNLERQRLARPAPDDRKHPTWCQEARAPGFGRARNAQAQSRPATPPGRAPGSTPSGR
jgi:hypothetical protein